MKCTKETLKRALKTFIQTVLAYLVINVAFVDFTQGRQALKTALTGLGVAALSAGLAAVMNLEKKEIEEDEL